MISLVDINDLKKKSKVRFIINLILISLLVISTITFSILSLLFSSLNYEINLTFNIVIDVIVAIFLIFYFLNIFPIVNHYYSFFKRANNVAVDKHRRLKFIDYRNEKTINNVKYQTLTFSYLEGENEYFEDLYLLDSEYPFEKGKNYKINTYKNVIVSLEVLNDAKI